MSNIVHRAATPFIERRNVAGDGANEHHERRQFSNSYAELSAAAHELADAIDQYKFRHRRRFIDYEEMLTVIKELGYQKPASSPQA